MALAFPRGMEPGVAAQGQGVDDLIVKLLEARGPGTIEDLAAALPALGWPAVFLAIDRLNRAGLLLLRPAGRACYQVVLRSSPAAG
jgi:hypothetical protein